MKIIISVTGCIYEKRRWEDDSHNYSACYKNVSQVVSQSASQSVSDIICSAMCLWCFVHWCPREDTLLPYWFLRREERSSLGEREKFRKKWGKRFRAGNRDKRLRGSGGENRKGEGSCQGSAIKSIGLLKRRGGCWRFMYIIKALASSPNTWNVLINQGMISSNSGFCISCL